MLTEITHIPNLFLEKLGIENCPEKALYYYYFTQAILSGGKIYSVNENNSQTLICSIPSKTLIIVYGNNEAQAIKALNSYKDLGNAAKDFYVISCLDLSRYLKELHFKAENRGFTKTFTIDKIDTSKIKPIAGYDLKIEESSSKIKVMATKQGRLASKCETLWIGSQFAEIGGGTEDDCLCKGLFTWVTGSLAKFLLEKDIQPLYIFEQDNAPSRRVGEKLFIDSGGREFTFYIKS